MGIYVTPLVMSDDGSQRLPAAPGRKLDPGFIPVDGDKRNLLEVGENGLHVLPGDLVSQVTPNALVVAPDSKLRVTFELGIDAATGELTLSDTDGAVVSSVKLPSTAGVLVSAEFLQNYTPEPPDGVLTPLPEGMYLHLRFRLADGGNKDIYINVQDLVDIYTPGFAIDITGNVVSVTPGQLINPHDRFLVIRSGTIQAKAGLAFDASQEILYLTGADDKAVAQVKIPVSIGVPLSIELMRDLEVADLAPGDYLRFDYAMPDGSTRSEYVEVANLPKRFTAGQGIVIEGETIAAHLSLAPGNALAADKTGGLYVNQQNLVSSAADNALTVTDNGLYVKPGLGADSVGAGLVVGADGKLSIDLDTLAALLVSKLPFGVSGDSDNALKDGSDGKPYFPGDLGKL